MAVYLRPAAFNARHAQLLDLIEPVPLQFRLLTGHTGEVRKPRRAPAGAHPRPHSHCVHHVLLFTHGENRILWGDRPVDVSPGMVVVCPPCFPHDFAPLEDGEHIVYDELTFTYHTPGKPGEASPATLDELSCAVFGTRFQFPQFRRIGASEAEELHRLFEQIIQNAHHFTPEHPQTLFGIFQLLRQVAVAPDVSTNDPASIPKSSPLDAILQYIHRNLHEDITLQDLTRVYHCSIPHLCRLFKQHLGISPYRYIQKQRMEAAASLLLYTGLSCQEIALQVGYKDLFAFSKAFRKVMGLAPRHWRRRQQQRHQLLDDPLSASELSRRMKND